MQKDFSDFSSASTVESFVGANTLIALRLKGIVILSIAILLLFLSEAKQKPQNEQIRSQMVIGQRADHSTELFFRISKEVKETQAIHSFVFAFRLGKQVSKSFFVAALLLAKLETIKIGELEVPVQGM